MVLMQNIYDACLRQAEATYIAANLFLYFLFARNPEAVRLRDIYYRPLVHKDDEPSTITTTASKRLTFLIDSFTTRSLSVDKLSTTNPNRDRLRNQDVISVLIRTASNASKYHKIKMSLKNLVSYIIALADWSMYEQKLDVADDLGGFFVVANGASRAISTAFEQDTRFTVDEINTENDEIYHVTVIMFIVTCVSVIAIAAVLLLPMLVRIERSKARVLDVFLSVPDSVRKSLRQKAIRVYRLVEKVEERENGKGFRDEEEEEDGDNTDGAASTAGSEATAFTVGTSLTVATEDSLAALFKRYNNTRVQNGMSLSNSMHSSVHKKRAHITRSTKASSVVKSPNAVDASAADGRQALMRFDDDASSLTSGAASLSQDTRDEIERRRAESAYNVWTGGAVRVASVRFFILVLLLCVYFTALLLETKLYADNMHNTTQRLAVGSFRGGNIILSLFFVFNHLFYEKSELAAIQPLEGAVHTALSFSEEGLQVINQADELFFAAVFGDEKMDIQGRSNHAKQNEILFGNLCELDPVHLYELYPDGKKVPHLLTKCEQAENSILTRGLYGTWIFVREQFLVLLDPQNTKAFAPYLTASGPTPAEVATMQKLKPAFDVVYQFYNNFVTHFISYSNAVYKESAVMEISFFNNVRFILIGVCFGLIFLSYFILVRPTTIILARTCRQANAMMLLLPPQILRFSEAARAFTDENVSSV